MDIHFSSDADIDVSDEDGNIMLDCAYKYDLAQAVLLLVKNTGKVDMVDIPDKTPFYVAKARRLSIYLRDLLKMLIAKNEGKLEDLGISIDVSWQAQLVSKYEGELQRMKSSKINNTNVTFHDMVTKTADQIALYMRNADVVQALRLKDYQKEFPEYARTIECRFKKCLIRKELLDEGHRLFPGCFSKSQDLPYECTDKILRYLSRRDLMNLKTACSFSPNNDVTKQKAL